MGEGSAIGELFDDLPEQRRDRPKASARPRVVDAGRRQVALEAVCLDDLLAPDHPTRAVWTFVERLDLGPRYALIRASEDRAGGRRASGRLWAGSTGSRRRYARWESARPRTPNVAAGRPATATAA